MKELKRNLILFLILGFSINTMAFNINQTQIEVKQDTLSDYQILTDSKIKYDFGDACYYGGTPPEGRIAIESLIYRKEYQTIKSVLDGNNKEGKIYAIEALLTLNLKGKLLLNQADKEKIKSIIEEDILINRCQGCLVSTIKSIDLFNERRFKILLKKNNIKIVNR
ncbi:hypothetical protein [Winogradskyella sp. 3972H.M.0a.05]|uniref:hypothetical protein n=1 Tax=Winogradskyella sp. 3972H.M.0a.05 TaxID=2950277 RepID=UPI0033915319